MSPIIVQMLNSFVRSLVVFLLGALAAKGIITQAQADEGVAAFVEILVPVLLAAGVAVYGVLRAKFQQKMLVTAQAMPQGSSTEEVVAVAKSEMAPDSNLPRDTAPAPISRANVEKAMRKE